MLNLPYLTLTTFKNEILKNILKNIIKSLFKYKLLL